MKRSYKARQSSGFLRSSKGRYLKKQPSPEQSFKTRSNQEIFIGHLVPNVSGKLTKKVQHFSQFMGSSESRYYQKQKKKNMRHTNHKKVPLNSQIFFNQYDAQAKKNDKFIYKGDPTTKEASKETSLSRASEKKFHYHELVEDGPQQMHFTMVKAQQQCKNVINN